MITFLIGFVLFNQRYEVQRPHVSSLLATQPEYGHVVTEGGVLHELASARIQYRSLPLAMVPVLGQPLLSMRLHFKWRTNTE